MNNKIKSQAREVENINHYLETAMKNVTGAISSTRNGNRTITINSSSYSIGRIFGYARQNNMQLSMSELDAKMIIYNACEKMPEPFIDQNFHNIVIRGFHDGLSNPKDFGQNEFSRQSNIDSSPKMSSDTPPKYHVRFLEPWNPKRRFAHLELKGNQLSGFDEDNIQILSNKGFFISVETLDRLNVKLIKSPLAMVYPWGTSNFCFNPQEKEISLYVEGRSDLLSAVELQLQKNYSLISLYNKESKIEISNLENVILLDQDDNSDNWLSRVISKPQDSVFKFIKSPTGKDLRDWMPSFDMNEFLKLLDVAEVVSMVKGEDIEGNIGIVEDQVQKPLDAEIDEIVFQQLPEPLKYACQLFEAKHEKEMFLLSAIVTLSACFPKVYGVYDDKKVFSNLFLFIMAPASSGKGVISFAKQLIGKINTKDGLDTNSLVIPANSTSTRTFELLNRNAGSGLIFESEGDTLTASFKTEHGNYSDALRKAFHHEAISFSRRKGNEHVVMNEPKLSVVLTGTINQVKSLITNTENGLFSRFCFYLINSNPEFKNVFNFKKTPIYEEFDLLSPKIFELYQDIESRENELMFDLTAEQKQELVDSFASLQDEFIVFFGGDSVATIRRLCLIYFRICMVFTILRNAQNISTSDEIICNAEDYQSVKIIMKVILNHVKRILPEFLAPKSRLINNLVQNEFFLVLPESFKRKEGLTMGENMGLKRATIDRMFNNANLFKKSEKFGSYKKIEIV